MRRALKPVIVLTVIAIILLRVSSMSQPLKYTGMSGLLAGQYLYIGGYSGTSFSPSPSFLIIFQGEGYYYSWNSSGMILSTRKNNNIVTMSGYIKPPNTKSSGLVAVLKNNSVRSFLIEGSSDIYLSDGVYYNGSIIVTGYFPQGGRGDLDVFVARLGLDGNLLGVKCYGSIDYPDVAKRLIVERDGFDVLGETWAYNVSQGDVLLLQVRDDLTLKDSWSIGGAGIDNGEDMGIASNGDYIIIGYTVGGAGTQGFVVRMSRVGGLLWIRSYSSLGDTFLKRVYVDGGREKIYILGSGAFEEDRRDFFLLVMSEVSGWILNESRLEIVRAGPILDYTVDMSGYNLFIYHYGGVAVVDLNKSLAVSYEVEGIHINETSLLDDSVELPYYSKSLFGWRILRNVVSERQCPAIKVVEASPMLSILPVNRSSIELKRGEFKREFDLGLAIRRFLERNVPILLLIPVIIVFLLTLYYVFRNSVLRRES